MSKRTFTLPLLLTMIATAACLLLALPCLTSAEDDLAAYGQTDLTAAESSSHTHALTFVQRVEPTCLEPGVRWHMRCTICEKLFWDTEGQRETTMEELVKEVPPAGHDWDDWHVTTWPTATTPGERMRTCKRDATHTQTEPIARIQASADIADVDDVLLNPGKGWVAYGKWNNAFIDTSVPAQTDYTDKVGIGYFAWDWAEIEPEHGTYNWAAIDDTIARFAAKGKQYAFGVMAANTFSERAYVTPKWVFDAGAKCEPFPNRGADNMTTQYVPDWNDEIFLHYMAEFVAALGEHYDGNPNLAYVDIRSYGNYGEQHVYGFLLQDPTREWLNAHQISPETLRDRYIQPYLDAFDKTLLVNPWGREDFNDVYRWAITQGASVRRDGIMYHSKDGAETALAAGKLPAIFETSWNYDYWKSDVYRDQWTTEAEWEQFFKNKFLEQMRNGQPSYIELDKGMYREYPEFCDYVANYMGYWFRLKHAHYEPAIARGDSIPLELSFANDGLTPNFRPASCYVALLDEHSAVVSKQKVDWNVFDWKPGTTTVEQAVVSFGDVPAGRYQIAFGMFASDEDATPTYLLGSTGKTNDNWYAFGTVSVDHRIVVNNDEQETPDEGTPETAGLPYAPDQATGGEAQAPTGNDPTTTPPAVASSDNAKQAASASKQSAVPKTGDVSLGVWLLPLTCTAALALLASLTCWLKLRKE